MIKIVDKDKDYAYVFSEQPSEIENLVTKMKTVYRTTYQEFPAILVRKEKYRI